MSAHELLQALHAQGLPAHRQLADMLDEHHEHRTERRGCGYTQATRLLAAQINQPQLLALPRSRVFADELDAGTLAARMREREAALFSALRLPESRLLACWLRDLVLRDAEGPGFRHIASEALKVGSCPLAEQFFLEIAYHRIRRGGRVNVIVAADGRPLLIEKRGLGDDHSCINVAELVVHGVRIPRGALFGIDYEDSALAGLPPTRNGRGVRLPIAHVARARLLRLTTLAVAPADRARAFSTHFQQQVDGGLYSPERTSIAQLVEFAAEQSA